MCLSARSERSRSGRSTDSAFARIRRAARSFLRSLQHAGCVRLKQLPRRAAYAATAGRPQAVRGTRADHPQAARITAQRVSGEARNISAEFLSPRPEQGLEGRQARPRHRTLRGRLSARKLERELLRHACAGAGLVLARHVRLAQGQPRRDERDGRACASSGRRHDHQGDVHAARRRLRQHPLGSAASDHAGRGGHDPRQPGLARWLVLGLGRMDQRLAAGLAQSRRDECVSVFRVWTVLHQLPFIGGEQPDLLDAQEHRRRTGRPAGVFDATILPRFLVAGPALPHRPVRHGLRLPFGTASSTRALLAPIRTNSDGSASARSCACRPRPTTMSGPRAAPSPSPVNT